MRALITMALAGAAFAIGGSVSAQALPIDRGLAEAARAPIETVAGGCGFGWHRGPWGGCRPNGPGPDWGYGPRPYWGPAPVWGPACFIRPGPWGPVRVCR